MNLFNCGQINEKLKGLFWKLPLSAEFKENLRVRRYERILEREAAADAGSLRIVADNDLLSSYAEHVLESYDARAEATSAIEGMMRLSRTCCWWHII